MWFLNDIMVAHYNYSSSDEYPTTDLIVTNPTYVSSVQIHAASGSFMNYNFLSTISVDSSALLEAGSVMISCGNSSLRRDIVFDASRGENREQ